MAGCDRISRAVPTWTRRPLVEQDDARGEAQRLVDVVRDEQNRLARRLVNAGDLLLQRVPRDGIERPERFVHQQHRRVARQRPRHADPLLLAARQLVRITAAKRLRCEMQKLQELGDAVADPRARPAQQVRHRRDVLFDGPVREQADRLDRVSHAPAQRFRFEAPDLLAGKQDATAVVLDQPVDHLERRGLARTGAADHDDEFALFDRQRKVVDGDATVERLADVLERDHPAGAIR